MSTARQLYGIAIPLAVSMVVTSGLFFTLNSASLADRPAKQTSDPAESSGDHQTTTQPISEAVELPSKTVPSERRRQQVRQLIQSLLPDREIAGLDIWVDQFADLPDDEIRFMVTQSSILQSDSLLPAMSGQKEDVSFGSQPMLHFDSPSRVFPGRSSPLHSSTQLFFASGESFRPPAPRPRASRRRE